MIRGRGAVVRSRQGCPRNEQMGVSAQFATKLAASFETLSFA